MQSVRDGHWTYWQARFDRSADLRASTQNEATKCIVCDKPISPYEPRGLCPNHYGRYRQTKSSLPVENQDAFEAMLITKGMLLKSRQGMRIDGDYELLGEGRTKRDAIGDLILRLSKVESLHGVSIREEPPKDIRGLTSVPNESVETCDQGHSERNGDHGRQTDCSTACSSSIRD